jgi:hypothetical protein
MTQLEDIEVKRVRQMFEQWLYTPMSQGEEKMVSLYRPGHVDVSRALAYYAGYQAGKKEKHGGGK